MTTIILKFEQWLVDQQNREDLIGDLACVPTMQAAEHKPSKRKLDEHKNWVDIVIGLPEPGFTAVFNEAWQEFLVAKKLATESLE